MGNRKVAYIISDALTSALGLTTEENLQAIESYRSGILYRECSPVTDTPMPIALMPEQPKSDHPPFTRLEKWVIQSIKQAISRSPQTVSIENCGFILSTTKGNIELLQGQDELIPEEAFIGITARRIADYFGIPHNHIEVISNACISGVSALVMGKRLIEDGIYRQVILIGVDLLSHFITSGFQSFHSISKQPCKPYDQERDGLSLGEACGTIILSEQGSEQGIVISGGAISNDANHISGPSRTGDGLYLAIRNAMTEAGVIPEDITFVNLHGTATVYNDEMEAKALRLARLEDKPVQSLKPYFGHTLGASGIIETIVCFHELKSGTLWGTKGYFTPGVSVPLKVSARHQSLEMRHCVKTASGFGGCNATLVLSLSDYTPEYNSPETIHPVICKTVEIEESRILVNGQPVCISTQTHFEDFIKEAYKKTEEKNIKFFKMDHLAKLAYMSAHHLLEDISFEPEEMAILLSNSSASLDTDVHHQQIIDKNGDEMASPSVFVYTLPNVAIGEICIRHKIQGENTFFILPDYDRDFLIEKARMCFSRFPIRYCIIGWCEYLSGKYQAKLELLKR